MEHKVSPLKAKPLRQAGQSVQEQLDNLLFDKLLGYFLVSAFMLALTVMEWIRYFHDRPPHPYPLSIITLLLIAYSGYKIYRAKEEVRRLKLGRDGERVVGEYLEKLREDGAIVFHDIVGEKFNIDHVILSSKGIYVIETKTYSKPRNGKVQYDGEHLVITGLGSKGDILEQVRAECSWLRNMLHESTGKYYIIRPVILFPGWWVDADNEDFWVLEPKQLPGKLKERPDNLSEPDKKLAAYHLSRYIRVN